MTSPGLASPAEQLGRLVKETQAVLHQRMDEALRPLGLSVAQYACLQTLSASPGATGSELARRVFVTRQAMNVMVQGLERQGMLERSDVPGPRRERETVLTPAGRTALDGAGAAVRRVVDTMTGDLADEDVAQLLALLGRCRDALAAGS
ncbi:MarR family winged helix-turn-helix transcriptional regulator [Nocardioides sp. CFH 31398]|uniref:MarR family winged helix-turn-helix transcriptional regulator n=1 Tax=Nocardioides sp. CFH 31398 TaxID=2919579 RepID=UPI001F0557E3|nr:MarR family winged helix-turn-helix transcriptional regulator [Nocardioides sp. CFH 31398]MCH1866196.1 MarR family winged helix-turn-helix transcriptional regulator [Nocardioides sp. CFH 31398]